MNEIKKKLFVRMPKGKLYQKVKVAHEYKRDSYSMGLYYRYLKELFFKGSCRERHREIFYEQYSGENICKINIIIDGQEQSIIMPLLDGAALETFWAEFPDLLMPYICTVNKKLEVLFAEGPYELNSQVSIKKNDVCIDCGANIGLFSAIASVKGEKCYAFEPSIEIVNKYLNITSRHNKNIEIVQMALGNQNKEVFFENNKENIGAGHIAPDGEIVKMITLDSWAEKNMIDKIDYIKADIEGGGTFYALRSSKYFTKTRA